ncbi:MBL fold metallo-hydrolase [Candidatus Bipolaricaulota bacterium]|nr:MBL fold metallo-hydrolase [Candidatus Bipolaricaulota bacterium]
MKITFAGAAQTVTGSCFHVETDGVRFLVDCGMYQGLPELEARNRAPFPFDPEGVQRLLLTHGHLDHLGLIPRLVREGFRGRIATTVPTRDIAQIMLLDAARIQEEDEEEPLYTAEDAFLALDRMDLLLEYGQRFRLAPKVHATFLDAGHILGAAFIVIQAEGKTVIFSGDLGNRGKPLVEDPTYPPKADVLILESTYGDRHHRPIEESIEELRRVIVETFEAGGSVVIPSFALERTQEVLYILYRLWRERRIPKCEIYLDSPLGTAATRIFEKHSERFPEPARRVFRKRRNPFAFELLRYTVTRRASKKIPSDQGGVIVIAGSGMCTGGRVLYHLKTNLPRPESSIVFVGYQAEGTLGRQLLEGAERVEILGSIVPVRARIVRIEGLSAHADQGILVDWALHADPEQVFLVHGEEQALTALAERLRELGISVHVPSWHETVEV